MKFNKWFSRLSRVLIAGFCLVLFACGLASFTMNEESKEIIIAGQATGILGSLADLFPANIPMDFNLEQELKARDAGVAESVYLTELRFAITATRDPDGSDNFNFLDSVDIHLEPTTARSALPARRLAWIDTVADGRRELFLKVDDGIDLRPYIEEGMRLKSTVKGSAPRNDVSMKVFAKLDVHLL
ncbi:MAG: hypothetical protein H0U74_07595 [Bradymonadaceae bacterium]|nr:hypothetical protein [Lujinxingiaceae bacterium]